MADKMLNNLQVAAAVLCSFHVVIPRQIKLGDYMSI